MVFGCAPALGKLSPRDLLDCFKDYNKPIIMRHGNVDITWSRGGGRKSSPGYARRGRKESKGPNHPTRSPNCTSYSHKGNNKKLKGKEVMATIVPIEGGDMQLVDHDNVFSASYTTRKEGHFDMCPWHKKNFHVRVLSFATYFLHVWELCHFTVI